MQQPPQIPTSQNHTHLFGVFFAFLGFSSFAIGDTGYKWLMQGHPFFTILFVGSIIAVSSMLAYVPIGGGIKLLKTSVPKLQISRALVITAQFLLSIYSIRYLPLPLFYTLAFTAPFMSAVLGMIFLKERVSKNNWVAIIVGLCGVCVALKPWTSLMGHSFDYNIVAICGIICASVFLATSQILARLIGQKSNDSGFTTAFYPIFCVLIISGFLVISGGNIDTVFALNHTEYLIVGFAAFCGISGNVFLAIGFAKAPPALAAPFHYTQIIWAIIFGTLIFNDPIDAPMIMGAILVISSGVYLITHKIHSAKQVADEPAITQI
jgi:drug/metabolite transporter (DMT)-like permease